MTAYRNLPHGSERISTLGLGMGGIQSAPPAEIEAVVREAIRHGINFFDLCAGGAAVYEPFGKAIAQAREQVYFQLHFGAVYGKDGAYGWSRNLKRIKETFLWELGMLGTDYADFGFLHCVDTEDDLAEIRKNGILDYVRELKAQGVVRHLGFSSHTPAVAAQLLDTHEMDMMMFSLNLAYDLECGDEYGIGTAQERTALLQRCAAEGIGVSVMKPFHGGQLLSEKTSPLGKALTKTQCLQYALSRPAVLTVVPGVRGLADLRELLPFWETADSVQAPTFEKDFSQRVEAGNCVYCNHCQPCPAKIDIGLVNKYYDLSLAGDEMAYDHYSKLRVNADACIGCGHCDQRCPFGVKQQAKMQTIANYFRKGERKA